MPLLNMLLLLLQVDLISIKSKIDLDIASELFNSWIQ